MISHLKVIAILVVSFQFGLLSAFVPRTVPAARSMHVNDMRSVVGPLGVTIASPTPTKSPDIEIASDVATDERTGRDPLWIVRLYNDPMNKREFVARCLVEICNLDDGEAFSVMMNAHKNGLSVIGTWQKELAEMYKQKLQEEGLFVDMVPADKEGDE